MRGAERGRQFHGRSSSIRWAGCSAIRAMTSGSQACGWPLFNLAVTIRLYITAARWPPRSEPANNHDFLPRAIPRSARSAALFERQIRPSSRKRVKLADLLVVAAGELLADMLDHFPLPRDDLQRLGDILAQLAPPRAAAAKANGRSRLDHPLPRQMLGEGLAPRTLAGKGHDIGGLGHGPLGGDL